MAKANVFQDFMDKAAKFLAVTVKKIKKMDRRLLIMIGAAAVLVIVIFALIIHGVSSDKNENEIPDSSAVGNMQELPSEAQSDVFVSSTNTYKVNTGSDADLNMRLAADRDSDVLKRIPNGTELEVLFIDDSEAAADGYGWGYVEYAGERGWVFMEFLKK
ncbi:MAG: SH3 domain-containing protein [Clostridia bacterium]|nr:SH3 domain-containing protein [Clostridia bacterium]